jgi:peptidoglycan hydrolase-like protein with peptidoglycan-binding domain
MAWRVAKSLEALRHQLNSLAPGRSKAADGGIGDAAHASRGSDHNPWVKDGAMGIVTARDFTHDPKGGIDARKLAEALVASRDPRIKYIISNRQIVSGSDGPSPWVWRSYSGSNPHTMHVHISVKSSKAHYDNDAPWALPGFNTEPVADAEPVRTRLTLRRGDKGDTVKILQRLLGVTADGDFGPKTQEAVKAFQQKQGLVADGICGAYTWAALA